jgi:peptidylprolyl isomerase
MAQPKSNKSGARRSAFLRAARAILAGSVVCAAGFAFAETPAPDRKPAPRPPAAIVRPADAVVPQATPAAIVPQATPTAANSEIVAKLGARNITVDEVRAFVATLGAREQAAIARDPALLSQAVRAMLANQLVLKEALEKQWDQQPAVAAQLDQVRKNAIVESYLQAASAPPAEFPNDAEIEKAYEANKTAFLAPRQYRIAQIFVALAKDADKSAEDRARKKLNDIQAQLQQSGADFGAVAKSASEDSQSAARAGEIGWVAEGQIKPEIQTLVVGLAVNAVGEPIKLDDGWHIIKLLDTKAAYTRPLAEVRDALAQQLRAQSAEANRRAYLAKMLEQNPPAINEIALSKLFEGATPAGAK